MKGKKVLALVMAMALTMSMSVTLTGCGEKSSGNEAVDAYTANIDGETANEISHTLAFDEEYFNDGDSSGFRSSGSDADHRAAEYLKAQFEEIGLETEIVPVKVDKWETGDKHLVMSYKEGGEDKTIELDSAQIISYMSNGTTTTAGNKNGKGKLSQDQWKDMEIVNVGCGYDYDYYTEDGKELDVKGKIVLAGVNQNNDAWIDAPYEEAYAHGAAAIIVYQRMPSEDDEGVGDGLLYSQNGAEEWDTLNVQDICAGDYIPCAGISPKSAAAIMGAMENGEDVSVDLLINSELLPGEGESWEVVGKLAGSGNSGQQIVYGGHYDKYFYGLNDDCTAVGLIAGIASSMVKSGFKPYNDIYFVATGAEEWGQTGSQYDWATGTWRMVTQAKPEWQGTTLAFIDFEMPAIASGQKKGFVQSTYEMSAFLNSYAAADLLGSVDAYYEEGMDVEEANNSQVYMSDCISYQTAGIPTIINKPDFDAPVTDPIESVSGNWHLDRYHTPFDDDSTYSQELMDFDIAYYGAMGIYMDQQPALELDMTKTIADLNAAAEGLENDVDADTLAAYKDGVAALEEAGKALQTKAQEINTAYAEEPSDELRAEGTAVTAASLELFKMVQDELIGFSAGTVQPYSMTGSSYMLALGDVIEQLENKDAIEDLDPLLGAMFGLWGGAEYNALNFGPAGYGSVIDGFNGIRHSSDAKVEGTSTDDWATGQSIKVENTYEATKSVASQLLFEEKAPADCDFDEAIKIYKNAREKMAKRTVKAIKAETKAMGKIVKKVEEHL